MHPGSMLEILPGAILLIFGILGERLPGWSVRPTHLVRSIIACLGVGMIGLGLFWKY
jgi:hypothetical protein